MEKEQQERGGGAGGILRCPLSGQASRIDGFGSAVGCRAAAEFARARGLCICLAVIVLSIEMAG